MADSMEYTVNDADGLRRIWPLIRDTILSALRGGPVVITLGRKKRTLDQNAKLWPMLADVAKQLPMVINGQSQQATADEWKQVFTASLAGEMRMAAGINGGVVLLQRGTSKMHKAEFSELIELIYAHGASNGVVWSEPAIEAYNAYREAQ